MPELDDDKTDKLFQVGASRYDFDYNPTAWDQMEKMLDADELRRQRLKWLLLAGGVLFLLLIAWLALADDRLADEGEISPEKVAVLSTTEPATEAVALNNNQSVPTGKSEGAGNKVAVNTALDGPASTPAGNNATAGKAPLVPARPPVRQAVVTPEDKGMLTLGENPEVQDAASGTLPPQFPAVPVRAVPPLTVKFLEEVPHNRRQREIVVVPDTSAVFGAKGPLPGFAVGLSAGFASGKTQTGSLTRPRLRLGGRIEYRLNNRLSVGTGAFLTKVDYKSKGKEYKTGEDFWQYDILPTRVNADCDILEIPLSLTWFPHGSSRSGVYFGAGLTSYFMLTEKFKFTYDVPDEELLKGWREDNTNQHLMGMGQFSVGFQRVTGKRSAVQIESFLQLPLTGIGHGKVNLLTVGASVNYTFDFRKRK